MALGACIAVKWTGLAWIPGLLAMGDCLTPAASAEATADRPFLRPTLVDWLLYAGVVPLVTYCLVWIPHELMTGENLITLHQRMWRFHQHLGQAVHPYCSAWYTWPLMLRPVAYQYEATPTVIYDVHGISNPMLIWLSTAAVGLLTIQQAAPLASQTIGWLRRQISQRLSKRIWSRLGVAPAAGQLAEQQQRRQAKRHSSIHGRRLDPVATYLVVNYALNWLPWALIHRCTFFYHYMSAAAFSFMGLAWWLSRWWQISAWRGMTVLLLAAIATAFWFWLPIHLGAPLSPAELQARWWLRSWI
jgi:dolichyl-phosphate-mannose--protein O-mannosyl transferase